MTAIDETKSIFNPFTKNTKDINAIFNARAVERIARDFETFAEPPSLDEVRRNISEYLRILHSRLGAISGPHVEAPEIWDTFLDVTKNTLIKWDDQNRNKFPKPRNDESIFVSLGTYRDPYCPMTIKSLYAKAKHPEKLFVSLFQQNCFEKSCKTGVLKGGLIEDTVWAMFVILYITTVS